MTCYPVWVVPMPGQPGYVGDVPYPNYPYMPVWPVVYPQPGWLPNTHRIVVSDGTQP